HTQPGAAAQLPTFRAQSGRREADTRWRAVRRLCDATGADLGSGAARSAVAAGLWRPAVDRRRGQPVQPVDAGLVAAHAADHAQPRAAHRSRQRRRIAGETRTGRTGCRAGASPRIPTGAAGRTVARRKTDPGGADSQSRALSVCRLGNGIRQAARHGAARPYTFPALLQPGADGPAISAAMRRAWLLPDSRGAALPG